MRAVLPRGGALRRSSPVLRAIALPLGALLLLSACGPSQDPDRTPSSSPSPTATIQRDPLADLESSTWSVTNREQLLEAPISPEGDVDTAAWEKDGIDDATIRSIQEGIADYVATAFLDPEALRGDSAEKAERIVTDSAPAVWKDKLPDRFGPDKRYFSATQFAKPFRLVGSPQAAMTWYLADKGSDHTVDLGGSIAYTVIDTETLAIGVYAVRIGVEVTASNDSDPIGAATMSITVHGLDVCRSIEEKGLVVPALRDKYEQREAQQKTLATVIADPTVPQSDIADENGMSADLSTIYDSGC